MTENYPPLVDLEINDFSKKFVTQEIVDTALRIVYERRPDLFARFAECERQDLGVEPYGNDFFNIVSQEVIRPMKSSNPAMVAACAMSEARRRSRLMYGMELRPKIKIVPHFPNGKSIKSQIE